jgi:hypothetical protein
MIPNRDSMLINELKKKYANDDTTNFGVSDFLAVFGSPVDAVMYLRLFWPEFIRFEGMVFHEETIEDDDDQRRVRDALGKYAGDKTRTEQSFNLVEFPSGFFACSASESSDDIDEFLAEKLAEIWAHRLAVAFPEEDFVVETVPAEETGGELGLIFYSRRCDV